MQLRGLDAVTRHPTHTYTHTLLLVLQVSGWEDRGLGGSSSEAQQAAAQLSEDLEAYSDPTELEALGRFFYENINVHMEKSGGHDRKKGYLPGFLGWR